MKRLRITVTLLFTFLMLTVPLASSSVKVAVKDEQPQKSMSSSYQHEIRFYGLLSYRKPNAMIVGGGNFISNTSSTISGVKCRFGFAIMKKDSVWVGHGAFNGMRFTINSAIGSGISNNRQAYYGFSGTIGVHYKGSFSIYVFKNQNGSYDVKFQILWKDAESPLMFCGTNIRGNILVRGV